MLEKVIVFDLDRGIVAEGESDLILIENFYVKIGKELYNKAFVCRDTEKNRKAVAQAVKDLKAARDLAMQVQFDLVSFLRTSGG